jgi:ribose 5-phosphate isomerase B
MKKIIIGADHRGFSLKENLKKTLAKEFDVIDAGTGSSEPVDYPDIAEAVSNQIISGISSKGILICGSGVGACVAANKIKGIRAAICHDVFSAHQGVEDDAMNILCLGGGIVGESLALDIIHSFLQAEFKNEERFIRRLDKVKKLENRNSK